MTGLTFAVVMVNECKGLTSADWMYWMLSCWALPSAFVPLMAGGAASGAAWAVSHLRPFSMGRYRLYRMQGASPLMALRLAVTR